MKRPIRFVVQQSELLLNQYKNINSSNKDNNANNYNKN